MRRWAAFAAALALSGASLGAAARQDEPCPEGMVCVEWRGRVIEVDPAGGPYQAVVVGERVVLAGFAANGDGYEFDRLYVVEKDGAFAEAETGDAFGLAELGEG